MKKDFLNKKNITLCFSVIFAIQMILLIIANLFFIDKNLDCDNAKLFMHIIRMWDHRTLTIPSWSYSTTLEWDCTSVFAIPFYAITHNIYIACGISNIILTCLFLGTLYCLLNDRLLFFAIANILLVPFSFGMLDYYNMMFFAGTQYIIKVTVPLLFIYIITFLDEKKKIGVKEIIAMVLYALFLLDTAMSSGIYVLAVGIAAAITGYFIYKFIKWEKIRLSTIVLFAATLIVYVLGMMINMKVLGGTRAEGMILCTAYEIQSNILSNFFGLFELFGGLTKNWSLKVISLEGVLTALKFVFVVVILAFSFYSMSKTIKGKNSLYKTLFTILFFWNLCVLFVAKTRAGSATSEYRYHLCGAIPLVILTVQEIYNFIQADSNEARRKLTACAVMLLTLFVSVSSYVIFFTKEDTAGELKELADYCRDKDYDIVYLYEGSNDTDILRVLDQSKPYICLLQSGQTFVFDYYSRYVLGGVQKNDSIVIVDNDYYVFEDEFTILDMNLKKVDEICGRSVYIFE